MFASRRVCRLKPVLGPAETLLDMGKITQKMMRNGMGINQICDKLGVRETTCLLALGLLESDDALKFQAMVECWPPSRILEAISPPRPEAIDLGHVQLTIP